MTSRRTLAATCAAALLAACGGASEDPAPPLSVVERTPAPGAAEATAASVLVAFSEPMDPGSLAGALTVAPAGGAPVAGSVTASGALARFTPEVPFPAATTLVVTVSPEVRSAAGGRLGRDDRLRGRGEEGRRVGLDRLGARRVGRRRRRHGRALHALTRGRRAGPTSAPRCGARPSGASPRRRRPGSPRCGGRP